MKRSRMDRFHDPVIYPRRRLCQGETGRAGPHTFGSRLADGILKQFPGKFKK